MTAPEQASFSAVSNTDSLKRFHSLQHVLLGNLSQKPGDDSLAAARCRAGRAPIWMPRAAPQQGPAQAGDSRAVPTNTGWSPGLLRVRSSSLARLLPNQMGWSKTNGSRPRALGRAGGAAPPGARRHGHPRSTQHIWSALRDVSLLSPTPCVLNAEMMGWFDLSSGRDGQVTTTTPG